MASSSTSLSVASSSSTHPWKYEVFLSFRGEDSRKSFTDHLHEALRRCGIKTFIDDQLRRGEQISSALLRAIEESRFSIIIFSEHYASSSWCLDELTKILECVKVGGHTAFPVFYNVDPSHVRKQTGSYGVAFARHEQVYRDNMEKVLKWREALTAASGLSGWDSRDRHESKVIKEIVSKIRNELNDASSCNMEALVGMDSHIHNKVSLSCIGFWTEAIWRLAHTEGNLNTRIFNRGINARKKTLQSKKILIVLDGLNDLRPLRLSPLTGLNFLKKLNLSDCNLLEGALPSDLSSLSWLECLDLSRNNFITVPASLTRLPHLRRLNLEHCKNLQSLAGLPSSSKELLANDCTSLETFSYPSSAYALRKFGDFNFEFSNCFQVMENDLSDTEEAILQVVLHDGSSSYIAFPSRSRRITRGDPRRSVIYHPQGQHTSLGHGGFHCYEISPSVGDIYGRINVRQSGPSTHSPSRSKFTDSVENFQSDSLACRTEGESYEPKGEVGYQSIKQKMEELNRMKDLICLFLSYPMNMVNRGIHERWVLRVLKINHKVRKIEATSKKEKIISPYASKLYSEVISLLGHSMEDIEAYVPREIIEKMCQKTLGVDKTTTIHAEVQMLSDSEEEQGKKATIHREGETLSDSDVDQGNKTTIHRVSQSDSEVEQSKKTTIHSESQTLSDSEVEQGRKTTIHRESRILCDSGVDQSQKATIHRKSEALSDSEEEQGEKASSQHDEIIPVPDDILDLAVEFAIRQILKAIENPEVRRIGISGRHGIRVTSKLKNLQQVREMFDVVVQVLALADSTINDIVENIAAQVDRLLNDTNFLILLDYIHENINLSQLGTYWWNSKNIQKIISTTRLQKVHHKMAIDLEIRMEDHLLPWELFCVNVGKVVHSSQIQGAAVDVVKRCHGHLLAIVLMGRALKEVNDVSIWKHASHALCLCPTSQMKDSILFNALAFICKQLGSKKRCVKHCALNMDKEGMDEVHLIQRWIKDGLIGTVDEGEVIVEDLLKAFLLESSQNGVSVGMRDEIREELGNLFAPVLNLGGEGLTMPPNDVSWEEADEIHLMNNELSELPYSPNCPQLRVLLLQANPFLTVIPHLFFEHMPSLQILDLSHTRIKFLPKSLSKLVKLRNFFLRSCELFMKVPPEVGELGNLEVLDFEGTEIISLPMDVGKLSKLMCLKLSFYGEDEDAGKNNRSTTIIPQNAIGKLLQLEELSIDVNPDDERWNETVKNIIKEVCSLKGLKVLKLYLPEVVLLNEFKQSEISFRSLSRFSFIVGGHLKRIISRLPRETTFEFKKQKRCLKYVNGEDIPVEIKEVLQHATALFLDRHLTLTKLSEFGIENMKELEVCVLGECKEIQTLVDGAEINKQEDNAGDVNEETVLGSLRYLSIHYMKNLRSIWEGPVQKGCLSSLKSLALHTCPQLTTIFTLDLLENLNFLEELVIENCPKINSLVTHELPAEEIQLCSIVHLPKLKKISLHYMHELVSISSGLHIAPKVEWMSFYGCPNLKTLSPMDVSSSNLKGIIGEVDWWNELTWNVQKENLDSIFVPIKGVTELMNQIAEIGDQLQH